MGRSGWLDKIRDRFGSGIKPGVSPEDRKNEFEGEVLAIGPSLYGYALRLVHNPDDAEDLIQDTVARAYQHFNQFSQGTNFKAWILRIMTNLYINQRRRVSREISLENVDEDESFSLYEQIKSEATEARNPEEIVLDQLGEDAISAVDSLPQDFRVVVSLVDIEGFTYHEASRILGIPSGTVRSRLHRGRALLQKKLYNYAKEMGYL